jgi:RNA polymerase sigma-70 factor, ECF subfamily
MQQPKTDPHHESLRSGDAADFEELVRSHAEPLWRVIWRIVQDERQADALLQETFVAAQAALGDFRGDVPASIWLRRIAVRQASQIVRARRAPGSAAQPDVQADPLHLPRCLQALDFPLRAAVALELEGASYREIAQVLERPAATVRSRLLLARDAVSKCMRRKRAACD